MPERRSRTPKQLVILPTPTLAQRAKASPQNTVLGVLYAIAEGVEYALPQYSAITTAVKSVAVALLGASAMSGPAVIEERRRDVDP